MRVCPLLLWIAMMFGCTVNEPMYDVVANHPGETWITIGRSGEVLSSEFPTTLLIGPPRLRLTPSPINAEGVARSVQLSVTPPEMAALVSVLREHDFFAASSQAVDNDAEGGDNWLVEVVVHPPAAAAPMSRNRKYPSLEFKELVASLSTALRSHRDRSVLVEVLGH